MQKIEKHVSLDALRERERERESNNLINKINRIKINIRNKTSLLSKWQ